MLLSKGRATVAVAALFAGCLGMMAIPNDAAAIPLAGSFGFAPTGAPTFNFGAETSIVAGITHKEYPGAFVNVAGTGDFAGIINFLDNVTLGAGAFDIPNTLHVSTPITPFDVSADGFTFNITTAILSELTPVGTGPNGSGRVTINYTGTVTAAPGTFDTGGSVLLSQGCTQASSVAVVNCSNTLTTPAPAPEPASLALLGTALAGFGVLRRRRRRRAA